MPRPHHLAELRLDAPGCCSRSGNRECLPHPLGMEPFKLWNSGLGSVGSSSGRAEGAFWRCMNACRRPVKVWLASVSLACGTRVRYHAVLCWSGPASLRPHSTIASVRHYALIRHSFHARTLRRKLRASGPQGYPFLSESDFCSRIESYCRAGVAPLCRCRVKK